MLLKHLAAEFEFHCTARELSERTIENYMRLISYLMRYLDEKHGITELAEVQPTHIKQFLIMTQQRGRKPAYVNDLLKAFKCMFRYAFEEGYTEYLITDKVKNVRQPKVLIRTFSPSEIKRMVSYHDGRAFISLRNRVMIMMLFDTGIRVSELIYMKVEQVKEGYILIHGKGNKERIVPKSPLLSKWLMKYLAAREGHFEYRGVPDYVFLSKNGRALTNEAIAKVLKDTARAVNVDANIRVSPHTCRHTFAHMQLKNGLDLYSLSRLLGHESISITQRYLEGIRDDEVLVAAKKTGVLANL